jgi:hypothetical protein
MTTPSRTASAIRWRTSLRERVGARVMVGTFELGVGVKPAVAWSRII